MSQKAKFALYEYILECLRSRKLGDHVSLSQFKLEGNADEKIKSVTYNAHDVVDMVLQADQKDNLQKVAGIYLEAICTSVYQWNCGDYNHRPTIQQLVEICNGLTSKKLVAYFVKVENTQEKKAVANFDAVSLL